MKLFLGLLLLANLANIEALLATAAYQGSSFHQVWGHLNRLAAHNRIYDDQLDSFPKASLTLSDLLNSPVDIYQAARESLELEGDFFPSPRKKLIRPNGICLAGQWIIDRPSSYTGVFASKAKALIIARASVAFDETTIGHYRSFGMAGKVFPTTDPDQVVKPAHFFLIDDNAGTLENYYTRASLRSEAELTYQNILLQLSLELVRKLLTISKAQEKVDPDHYKIRQLYPLSEAGLSNPRQAKTPALMKLIGAQQQKPVQKADFRHELQVEHYPAGQLKFELWVAAQYSKKPIWERLGTVVFTKDVVSSSCDRELRFVHPRWKN